MDIKRMGVAHGDKIGLVLVGAVCAWSLRGSLAEIGEPKGPSEELKASADRIAAELDGPARAILDVPEYGKLAGMAKRSHGKGAGQIAAPPGRMVYAMPPVIKVVELGGGSEKDPLKIQVHPSVWLPPVNVAAKPELGRVTVRWSLADEVASVENGAVAERFVVKRQKKGAADWGDVGTVEAGADLLGKDFSFVDKKVGPKESYKYKVSAVGTARRYPAGGLHKVLPPKEKLISVDVKTLTVNEVEVKVPVWHSPFTESKEATTPGDVKLFLMGTATLGEKKANILVAKYDADNGWQYYNADKVAVNDEIIGSRLVRKLENDAIRQVTETAPSDFKLLGITDKMIEEEYEDWEMRADKDGNPIRVKVKKMRHKKLQSLKVLDMTLKKELTVPSIRDVPAPPEGSGAGLVPVEALRPRKGAEPAAPGAATTAGKALVTRGRGRGAAGTPGAGGPAEEARLLRIKQSLADVEKRKAERLKREEEARKVSAGDERRMMEEKWRRADEEDRRMQEAVPRYEEEGGPR